MAEHITPTAEQLERAWRELAQPEWGELADAQRAAARFSLVRARALALARGHAPTELPATPAAAPAPKPWMGSLKVSHTEALHDRKSAAAGEREDD